MGGYLAYIRPRGTRKGSDSGAIRFPVRHATRQLDLRSPPIHDAAAELSHFHLEVARVESPLLFVVSQRVVTGTAVRQAARSAARNPDWRRMFSGRRRG
jgi:hypothetical protein